MDRCALFVDAGYLLADGAMAVHGTRHREAVSWDYPGLLKLLSSLSKDRTGLPLLRCYWYEASVEGRRTAEHDALADIPGLKLRLSRIRPGRREGVDAQVHRDLMTLARNSAVCDAVVVSGDEDLAQVVCDAQDLGIRVTVVHIATDGNWAVSRSLRQECDDLIEIGGGHLRPYVSLTGGAVDPPHLANGHQPTGNGHQPTGNGQVTAAPTAGSNGAAHAHSPAPRVNPAPSQPSQPALPSYPSYNHEPPPAPAPAPAPQQAPPPPAPNGPTGPMPAAPQYALGNTGNTPSYQPGQLGVYTGPQAAPVPIQSMANSSTTTLSDAVKAAHKEGYDFGESVAKDAPALWLEAVLARKPRMPSDLEARLLQGSSLPIDFLLHDEVRHALRRGFWDALERARR
ncbi:NYN domain-containing protein [Streptosporangium sp. NBC_01639]|uniref:NYN domain-containing protein n=1 Tax=Streptosporangium sp. NBC_01639 TaxID=2975948 RepID=UPI00386D77BB|nr:NYN domain-containing protein [Streptosporangium sp. NBC_01639]